MKFRMALIWLSIAINYHTGSKNIDIAVNVIEIILPFIFVFSSFSVILINSNLSATLQIHTRLRNEEESVIMNLFLRRSSSAFIFCFVLAAHEIDYKSISHFENNVYNEVT